MAVNALASELFVGFSKLNLTQRLERLQQMGALTTADIHQLLNAQAIKTDLAENLIENVIGYFQMPLGVATNFRIDGKDVVIPMAVEETSIVAALCKTAKWIRAQGHIRTEVIGSALIGQLQIARVKNFAHLSAVIEHNKAYLIQLANRDAAKGLVARGGGVQDIRLRQLKREDGAQMAILHVYVDCCDAMGANIINQILEFLKAPIESLTDETIDICILSNLNDEKITRAEVTIENIDPELGYRLQEASLFAELDPYRAATSNKGVLNGMDAVLIATGNDWRAVEAGAHAYACRNGQYSSLSRWRMQGDDLVGRLEAPINVGIVGGVTKLHPTAQLCLRMLTINSANELSRIIAAVGLVQNLGAIRALTTDGIVQGHMKLHIDNLSLSAGANAEEMPLVRKRLQELLAFRKRVTLNNALEILHDLRNSA